MDRERLEKLARNTKAVTPPPSRLEVRSARDRARKESARAEYGEQIDRNKRLTYRASRIAKLRPYGKRPEKHSYSPRDKQTDKVLRSIGNHGNVYAIHSPWILINTDPENAIAGRVSLLDFNKEAGIALVRREINLTKAKIEFFKVDAGFVGMVKDEPFHFVDRSIREINMEGSLIGEPVYTYGINSCNVTGGGELLQRGFDRSSHRAFSPVHAVRRFLDLRRTEAHLNEFESSLAIIENAVQNSELNPRLAQLYSNSPEPRGVVVA